MGTEEVEINLREDIREWLIQEARAHRLITYKELGEQFNIPAWWRQLRYILNDISVFERDNGRPYLSAIVVRQDTRRPGPGFWSIPEIDASRPWQDYRDDVWRYWLTHQ
jgi:hypothetical protein